MSWDVEGALLEVTDAIEHGAALAVEPATAQKVRDDLRNDFQRQKDDGADWPTDRVIVLGLARMVGVIASAATFADWDLTSPPPTSVDADHVDGALHLVARTICPQGGGYCQHFAGGGLADPPTLERLKASIMSLITRFGLTV